MKTCQILGNSSAALCLIIENLFDIYARELEIVIIRNLNSTENGLPFNIDPVSTREVFHKDFEFDLKSPDFIIGALNVDAKVRIFEFFHEKYSIFYGAYITVIPSKGVNISRTVKIGNGCLLNYGVTIAPYAVLGDLVTVNRNVSIGHHTTIGDFVTIAPGVNIAGRCRIGKKVSIGIGANIFDGVTIGENSIIGGGTLVTKDIPANVMAYGVPAKIKS